MYWSHLFLLLISFLYRGSIFRTQNLPRYHHPSVIVTSVLVALVFPTSVLAPPYFFFACKIVRSFLYKKHHKVAQNSFEHFSKTYILMGHYNLSYSGDATVVVSKNCPIIGEHVIIIFVTQQVTTATEWPAKNIIIIISSYFLTIEIVRKYIAQFQLHFRLIYFL